jgi:hypothetical protein
VRFNHAFAMYKQFPRNDADSDTKVWRAAESLGLTKISSEPPSTTDDCRRVEDDDPNADIVVLDDAGFGFRDHSDLWPKALSSNREPWVIFKMAGDVMKGKLWEMVANKHAKRLIVILPIGDLRRTKALISRQLSWDRTAQDLVLEWRKSSDFALLRECAHVIVSFGSAGAVHLKSQFDNKHEAFLFFAPLTMEDQWEKGQGGGGGMYGYTVTLTAAIAREFIDHKDEPNITRGIQRGVAAIRQLYVLGNAELGKEGLAFPHDSIANEITKDAPDILAKVGVPVPKDDERLGDWTILGDQYASRPEWFGTQVAKKGLEILNEVPVGRFGSLATVDRREIEALQSIRNLIVEYCDGPRSSKPLSIAVFGPPGSGKSFAVKQVASTILPGAVKELTFNLSQFANPSELLGAFHQVRDAALSGKLPLVFWDEFDSQLDGLPLGWLRYFLAPMQDGEFQQGDITHPIGHSIFVFAGGTADRMDDLGEDLKKDDNYEKWKAAKGPDFLSRLKGFLDVLGPNPPRADSKGTTSQKTDPYYVIRRAILLRSLLSKRAKQFFTKPDGKGELRIDDGVLHAFLTGPDFKHGARSMETIVATSVLSGRNSYERSSLPPAQQLNLHVNGEDFLSLVRGKAVI